MSEWITSTHAVFLERIQALVQSERRSHETICDTVQRLLEERDRLHDLIVTYATTPMTFEQFLEFAVGKERAAEIMGVGDEQQRALLEQWHERMPGNGHADRSL